MLAVGVNLCCIVATLPSQATDWLVHPPRTPTTLRSTDDGELLLTNGLISRAFIARGGAFCTVDMRQEKSDRSYFRALAPEANLSLSIAGADDEPWKFDVGGCAGQPSGHFEFFDADVLLPNLTANASAFQYTNHTTSHPVELFPWKPGARGAPTDIAWPPHGLHLAVNYVAPPAAHTALRSIVVTVHYEMYDGLPTYRKWVSVAHTAADDDAPRVVVDTLHYELLRGEQIQTSTHTHNHTFTLPSPCLHAHLAHPPHLPPPPPCPPQLPTGRPST